MTAHNASDGQWPDENHPRCAATDYRQGLCCAKAEGHRLPHVALTPTATAAWGLPIDGEDRRLRQLIADRERADAVLAEIEDGAIRDDRTVK